MQAQLAEFFWFRNSFMLTIYQPVFNASAAADLAMHGLRKIDTNSIGKTKGSAED